MNADEIQPRIDAVFEASLTVLQNVDPNGSGPSSEDCTDAGGAYTGKIRVGALYLTHNVPREIGLRDLHALQESWIASGYTERQPTRWDREYISVFYRDDSAWVNISAQFNGAGDFYLTVMSPCVNPSRSTAPSPSPPKSLSLDEIRRILG